MNGRGSTETFVFPCVLQGFCNAFDAGPFSPWKPTRCCQPNLVAPSNRSMWIVPTEVDHEVFRGRVGNVKQPLVLTVSPRVFREFWTIYRFDTRSLPALTPTRCCQPNLVAPSSGGERAGVDRNLCFPCVLQVFAILLTRVRSRHGNLPGVANQTW